MRRVGGRAPGRFWKSIGGYIYCVTVRGRWYYVGCTWAEAVPLMQRWFADMQAQGIATTRVSEPQPVERLFMRYGRTPATLIQHLPHYGDLREARDGHA